METTLKKDGKFCGKTHKNELNKQQTEQCRHLANLSELFLVKSFYGDNAEEGRKFQGKTHRNSSINRISSKQNDGTT